MSECIINEANALDQYIDLMGEEGGEFVIDIIKTFLENVPGSFALLDQGLATNDSVIFRRAEPTSKLVTGSRAYPSKLIFSFFSLFASPHQR